MVGAISCNTREIEMGSRTGKLPGSIVGFLLSIAFALLWPLYAFAYAFTLGLFIDEEEEIFYRGRMIFVLTFLGLFGSTLFILGFVAALSHWWPTFQIAGYTYLFFMALAGLSLVFTWWNERQEGRAYFTVGKRGNSLSS